MLWRGAMITILLATALASRASAQRSDTAASKCYALDSHVSARSCLDKEERKAWDSVKAAEQELVAAVRASAVSAGTMPSSKGSGTVAPIPRSTVRRDR